ncbi:MAG: hypothetical protein E6Q34_09120, partial [Burkholderiaceae bacterium]
MNSDQNQSDVIDQSELHHVSIDQLLQDYYEAPVEDGGFSQRLMQTLPRKRRMKLNWIVVGQAFGFIALLWKMSSTTLVQNAWQDLSAGQSSPMVWLLCAG